MKYILLLVVSLNGHGLSITNVEFNTKESCKAAGELATKRFGSGFMWGTYYVCAEKPAS